MSTGSCLVPAVVPSDLTAFASAVALWPSLVVFPFWATPAVASTKVQAIAMALLNTVDILIWFGSRPYRGLGPGAGKERKCNPCGSNKEVPCYCAYRSGNEGLLPYKEKTPAFPVIGMPGPWKDGWLELLRY